MEFKQLQSFAALVQYRSFSKVADKLFISQPTVSTHIRDLEKELKTKLVIRTTHSVDITEKGYELYTFASRVLEMRDNLLEQWSNEEKALLNIGASTIPAAYVVPKLLVGFERHYSDIRVILKQGDSKDVIEGVQRGAFDIGFAGMKTEDPELVFLPICKDHMVLITPNKEPFLSWKQSGVISLEELKKTPFLKRESGSGSQKNADLFLEEIGIKEEERISAGQVSEQESLKKLVAAGIGVAVSSSRSVQEEAEKGELLAFELPGTTTERELYVLYRNDEIRKSGMESFVRYIKLFYGI
jgi:LysR family transcriptional regulator, transcriptional activator of the cysJI operon